MHTRTKSDARSTTFINSSRRPLLDWRPCFSPDTIQSAALIAMRYLSLVLLVVIVMLPLALGQTTPERALEGQLKRVFHAAITFSQKQTHPLHHFVPYTGSPCSTVIAEYIFSTTELHQLVPG